MHNSSPTQSPSHGSPFNLSPGAYEWVEHTLEHMSLRQCLGQLLCPILTKEPTEDTFAMLREFEPGGLFVPSQPPEQLKPVLERIQREAKTPVVVCADIEHSPALFDPEAPDFPRPMGMGAANDLALMQTIGEVCAKEARAFGVHWTLAPVVDLSLNFLNQITNTRAIGDQTETAVRLIPPWMRALQANGLAATAKHFPGDGVDDRDQHLCTSVNSLPFDEWEELYGTIWRKMIDEGVLSIMTGHISLPSWTGGDPAECLPATIEPKLIDGLLRRKLGFAGVVVSDAAPMVGLTSRCHERDLAATFIRSGGDVYLFSEPEKDLPALLEAIEDGLLSEERVRESVRRVLSLKAHLGLHEGAIENPPTPSKEERAKWHEIAAAGHLKAATWLKSPSNKVTAPKKGAKLLAITLRPKSGFQARPPELTDFVDALTERGYEVTHELNPSHRDLNLHCHEYETIFVNVYLRSHMQMGVIRPTADLLFSFWRSFVPKHRDVRFTSFGTPYLEYDMPWIPNLLGMWTGHTLPQQTAVKVWLGEAEAGGTCPVVLPKVTVRPWRPYL